MSYASPQMDGFPGGCITVILMVTIPTIVVIAVRFFMCVL